MNIPVKTILLDGGMGQELVRRSSRPVTPLWSSEVLLHEADVVTGLHSDYIDAGADVITLASYTATPERLTRDGVPDQFDALQAAAAQCAHDARERSGKASVRIAACLPPLVASYHPDTVPSEAQALESYRRIAQAQASKADLMLCETMASIAEARYAATAALETGKPVWVALTVSDDAPAGAVPTLRSGEPVADAARQIHALGVDAVLVNCSTPEACTASLAALQGALADTAAAAVTHTGAYANAFIKADALAPGGTVANLEARQDLDPDTYAGIARTWQGMGATIIGGCCETRPAHIAAIRKQLPLD